MPPDGRRTTMRTVVFAEAVKLAASPVGVVGTVAIVGGVAVLSGAMLLAVASGDPDLVAKLGSSATLDWNGFLLAAAQITGAGGVLGYGVVLSWIFGREFSDATVGSLYAAPAGRSMTATGKLILFAAWSAAISLTLTSALLVVGLIAGLGMPPAAGWWMLARQGVLALLTAAITTPVAWVATLARSTLGGVTASIGILVVAQVAVLAGAGGWMPFAAPTLWAMSGGAAVHGGQLALVAAVGAAACLLTITSWRRLQLDR